MQRSVDKITGASPQSFFQPTTPYLPLPIRWVKLSKAGSDPAGSHTDRPKTQRSIGNEGRLGLPAHSVLVGLAKDRTSDRSQFRSSIASIVQFPVLKLPFFGPRGAPGLRPPCRRHRLRPRIAGRWHGVPVGVLIGIVLAKLRPPRCWRGWESPHLDGSELGLTGDPPGGH